MLAPLTYAVVVLAAALTGWAVWFVVRDRAVILRQLWGAAVVEGALLVQLVVALVVTLTRSPDVDMVSFWGYLITVLLILPLAAVWAFAERTRWSSVVLAVAGVTVMFLEFRLTQIWGA